MRPHELVARLYSLYQEREWDGAACLLHPDARLHMPATDERLVGRDAVIALQREYPEPWGELRVLRTTGEEPVAAEVEIRAADGTYRCAAFWTVREGRLAEGVEYWVTVGGERADPERRPPA